MIQFLIVSLVFFFLGRHSLSTKDVDNLKKFVNKFRKDRVGAVQRPTAEKLRKKGTLAEQEEKAMEELLDKKLK